MFLRLACPLLGGLWLLESGLKPRCDQPYIDSCPKKLVFEAFPLMLWDAWRCSMRSARRRSRCRSGRAEPPPFCPATAAKSNGMYSASKPGSPARILGKILLLFTMLLASCASDRESVVSPFFPAGSSGEYGDEISYWDGARSRGKPRIIIDLEQQRAYFYKGGE